MTNGLTPEQQKIVKQRFQNIKDSQDIVKKVMPESIIDSASRKYITETINIDDTTILDKSDMEVINIPYGLSDDVKRIFDLNAKIVRPTRMMTNEGISKFSIILAKIITKSINYHGINELVANGTEKVTTNTWDACTINKMVEDVEDGVFEIMEYSSAPINMIVPTSKRKYLNKLNDYGLKAIRELDGTIANIYTSNFLNPDTAVLVPYDASIVTFNKATPLSVDLEVFEKTQTKLIATQAICPSVDDKNGVIVLKGI
ncbi:hypothetical protein J2127_001143 [Methanococcus voltae]|uniref:hypothetical protein n=1 Tax=Methanococcus voltae TaxID=2188 RepID=UPI001AE8FF59|nr:hypothetical protein [Methanococcus voltae]MBP2143974.1 hypothetical protein [Methanococcus voltae]